MSSLCPATGAKHICQLCGYQTLQKTHLKLHCQAAHEGRRFQCSECKYQCLECDYQVTAKGNLVSHKKSVRMGQKFQCPECDYQATQKSKRVTHHKNVHMGRSVSMR